MLKKQKTTVLCDFDRFFYLKSAEVGKIEAENRRSELLADKERIAFNRNQKQENFFENKNETETQIQYKRKKEIDKLPDKQ